MIMQLFQHSYVSPNTVEMIVQWFECSDVIYLVRADNATISALRYGGVCITILIVPWLEYSPWSTSSHWPCRDFSSPTWLMIMQWFQYFHKDFLMMLIMHKLSNTAWSFWIFRSWRELNTPISSSWWCRSPNVFSIPTWSSMRVDHAMTSVLQHDHDWWSCHEFNILIWSSWSCW